MAAAQLTAMSWHTAAADFQGLLQEGRRVRASSVFLTGQEGPWSGSGLSGAKLAMKSHPGHGSPARNLPPGSPNIFLS